jgi:hypothetical protein
MKPSPLLHRVSCLAILAFAVSAPIDSAHAKGKQKLDSFIKSAIEKTATEPVIEVTPEPEPAITDAVLNAPEQPIFVEPVAEVPQSFKTFNIRPSLELMESYDSNVFATQANEVDDFITTITPALNATLKTETIDLSAHARYEHNFYTDNANEDHGNVFTNLDGSLVVSENLSIPVTLAYSDRHQARHENHTTTQPSKLLFVQTFHGATGLQFKSGNTDLLLKGFYTHEDFENGTDRNSTAAFIRSDSDRESFKSLAQIGYDFNEMAHLYVKAGTEHRDYKRLAFTGGSFSGNDRDSEAYYAMAGLKLTYQTVSALIEAGYKDRDYDDTAINDVDDMIAKVQLGWQNTQNTSMLSALFTRELYEDDDIITPMIKNSFGISGQHHIDKDWSVSAHVNYDILDFQNSARQDEMIKTGLGLDYTITPFLSAGIGYEFLNRESDAANLDYDKHIAMVRVKGQLP